MALAGTGKRSLAARLALALFPPGRWLFRPDPASLELIRFGLGLADEVPRSLVERLDLLQGPAGQFALLALHRLRREDREREAAESIRRGAARQFMRMGGLVREVQEALDLLHAAGVPVMLLKGLPLVLFTYRDLAARPMADADLLVPLERLPEALTLLREAGYGPRLEDPAGLATAPGHVDHSVALRRGSRPEIDLHYFALDECRWPGADRGLWERAEERRALGSQVRIPARTDLLLHLCAHGYRLQRGAPRWAADAGFVLLEREGIDWDLFVAEARRRRLVLPLEASLRWLRDEVGLPVPDSALEALEASPVAPWEPFDFWVRAATSLDGRVRRLFLAVVDYLRFAGGQGLCPSPVGFVRYLCERWGLPGPAALLREVARRALEVVMGRPARRPASEQGGTEPPP